MAPMDQEAIDALIAERDLAVKNYTNLTQAQEKLKADLVQYKSSASDASALQKQIENLVSDKTKLLKEKEEVISTFDSYRNDIRAKETKVAIAAALEAAGARAPTTALKLLDMDAIKFDDTGKLIEESITEAIEALKNSDSILFGTSENKPTAPTIKHAQDRVSKSAFDVEMEAAVKAGDQNRLNEVFEKYQGR